jgi:hypothetical protein
MSDHYLYDKIKAHLGHHIVGVHYGDWDNVAIECEDCGVVIIDSDREVEVGGDNVVATCFVCKKPQHWCEWKDCGLETACNAKGEAFPYCDEHRNSEFNQILDDNTKGPEEV